MKNAGSIPAPLQNSSLFINHRKEGRHAVQCIQMAHQNVLVAKKQTNGKEVVQSRVGLIPLLVLAAYLETLPFLCGLEEVGQ